MPRRGENIRKRKDGRWEGRYRIQVNGENRYVSVYGHSYSEVKEKLFRQKQNPINCSNKKRILFQDVLGLWLNSVKYSIKGATENKYTYLIEKHILPDLGKIEIHSIKSSTINDFLNKKLSGGRLDSKGPLSSSYVRTLSHIITAALNFAVDEQLCLPIKFPKKPSTTSKDLTILSYADQLKLEKFLLNNINETTIGILLSLNLGLRIGEVCALTWEDIDLDMRIIRVRTTISRVKANNDDKPLQKTKLIIEKPKTKSSLREIPIPDKLVPILSSMKDCSRFNFIVSTKATFISPRTFEYRYHRILEKAGIAPINFHSLRHTFATRCIEAGVDAKTLSEILGHANVSITLNIYVHSSMDLKRKQLEKVFSLHSENKFKVVKKVV